MTIKAIAALASGNFVGAAGFTAAAVGIKIAGRAAGAAIRGDVKKMAEGGVIDEPVMGIGQRTGQRYLMGEAGPEVVSPMTQAGNDGAMAGNISINNLTIYAQDVNDFKNQLGDLYRQTGSRQYRR